MAKFDKFTGGNKALTDGSGARGIADQRGGRASTMIDQIRDEYRDVASAERRILGKPAKIAFALDATGSMANLIEAAKGSLAEIIRRVSAESPRPLEIEIFVYRDYDVPNLVMQRSGLATDAAKLVAWLKQVRPDGGGGNAGEAVEAAIDAIVRAGDFSTVILAGDEPSNPRADLNAVGRHNTPTAHDLATGLGRSGVPIHSFVVGADPRTIADFRKLSDASGGKSGRLDGTREMIDLAVMAILAAIEGTSSVARYASNNLLSSNAKAYAQLLIGGSK